MPGFGNATLPEARIASRVRTEGSCADLAGVVNQFRQWVRCSVLYKGSCADLAGIVNQLRQRTRCRVPCPSQRCRTCCRPCTCYRHRHVSGARVPVHPTTRDMARPITLAVGAAPVKAQKPLRPTWWLFKEVLCPNTSAVPLALSVQTWMAPQTAHDVKCPRLGKLHAKPTDSLDTSGYCFGIAPSLEARPLRYSGKGT